MKKKKSKNFMTRAFLLLILVFCASFVSEKQVSAASYKRVEIEANDDNIVKKCGTYYFKYASGYVYVSRSRNDGYSKTPMTCKYSAAFVCDGKQTYYLDRAGKVLYRYDLKHDRRKKIKRLISSKKKKNAYISAIYKNNIYLTYFDDEREDTYVYNITQKKITQKVKDCSITEQKGKYAVSELEYYVGDDPDEADPYAENTVDLYQLTKSGLKKIKRLCDDGEAHGFVNGKLYYSKHSVERSCMIIEKEELYRCNPNGKGNKKLVEISSNHGKVCILKVASKYCITYFPEKGYYKYNYKTGKRKKITLDNKI